MMMQLPLVLFTALHLLASPFVLAVTLRLQVPPNIPALPPSSTAYLTAHNSTLSTPVTRANSFVFHDLSLSSLKPNAEQSASSTSGVAVSYLLDIACRDYDFASYGVDVKSNGFVEIYRVARGGWEQGGRVTVGDGPLELRVLKARDFYDKRGGCRSNPWKLCEMELEKVLTTFWNYS